MNNVGTLLISAINQISLQRGISIEPIPTDKIPDGFSEANNEENVKFKESCQKVGIFSTSLRPDNQPLWAYYANDFKGVCFEFEWTKEITAKNQIIPVSVDYSTKQRIINRAIDTKDLLIETSLQNPDWSIKKIIDYSLSEDFRRRCGILSTARAISTKHADWKHEEEIRFVTPYVCNIPIYSILKKVFYVQSNFPEFISIIRLLKQLYPDVEIINLNFNHQDPLVSFSKMAFKEIPIEE